VLFSVLALVSFGLQYTSVKPTVRMLSHFLILLVGSTCWQKAPRLYSVGKGACLALGNASLVEW